MLALNDITQLFISSVFVLVYYCLFQTVLYVSVLVVAHLIIMPCSFQYTSICTSSKQRLVISHFFTFHCCCFLRLTYFRPSIYSSLVCPQSPTTKHTRSSLKLRDSSAVEQLEPMVVLVLDEIDMLVKKDPSQVCGCIIRCEFGH